MAAFTLGQRIIDFAENARGTVKYIGAVDGTKGQWIGIDWDDPKRGKHDGSHAGKNYFTSSSPTSGSFVREAKISVGVTFEAALEDRYGGSADADPEVIENIRRDINAPFLQLVGFEKVNQAQSNFCQLKTISVRDKGVYAAGTELETYAVNVLDIAENLFDSWEKVAQMCQQLQKLRNLNVSDNFMKLPSDDNADMTKAFNELQTLFMGRMGYDWSDCQAVLNFMPKLQVLHVYENKITEIKGIGQVTNLTEINLTGNPLNTWENILPLSTLPKLQKMALNRCSIEKIDLNKEGIGFPALNCLQISENKLTQWQSIFCLNFLPMLKELKYKDNPIVDSETATTSRQIVIASIANLKIANGTEIEKVERFGAEVDFLKKYGLEYLEAVKEAEKLEAFFKKCPRYQELVKKFGAPEESELRVKDTSLKANLLKVNFVCPDHKDVAPLSKSLPPAMVISKLQGLLTRLIKPARGKTVQLSYTSSKKPDFEVPLDNDMRDLFFYNVESGDTIYVRW